MSRKIKAGAMTAGGSKHCDPASEQGGRSSSGVDRQIERVPIDSVSIDAANVRRHPDRNLAAIKASLAKFGQQTPIIVDARGVVIVGNGRLTAAKQLGWTSIDVLRTSLNGAEAIAYAIADNRTAELAQWDDDALQQQFEALAAQDEELAAATGFDASDFESTEPVIENQGVSWKLIVDCETEQKQAALMERLESEGYPCHPLMS
jgi:ParB-like chromosome segregation protein Spo0J